MVQVNADDLEACALAAKMAVSYRLKFRKEFVIDLIGYRRHGHNENDEPRFTQPITYVQLKEHLTLREKWARRLIEEEVVSQDEADGLVKATFDALSVAMKAVDSSGKGTRRQEPADLGLTPEPMHGMEYPETSVVKDRLLKLNDQITSIPDDFKMHPTVNRSLARRVQAVNDDNPSIDWAHAEALALGSVLQDGIAVRLTGQDCARGTFSQRHAVVWEQETGRKYCPLKRVEGRQVLDLQ